MQKSLLVLLAVTLVGCKARTFGAGVASEGGGGTFEKIRVPDKDVYLFNWSGSQHPEVQPPHEALNARAVRLYLENALAGVEQRNRDGTYDGTTMFLGDGLYFAEDPVSSYTYGTTLTMLRLKAGRTLIQVREGQKTAPVIRSTTPAIRYGFNGWFSGTAIVVRNRKIVDEKEGWVFRRGPQWQLGEPVPDAGAVAAMSVPELVQAMMPYVESHAMLSPLCFPNEDGFTIGFCNEDLTLASDVITPFRTSFLRRDDNGDPALYAMLGAERVCGDDEDCTDRLLQSVPAGKATPDSPVSSDYLALLRGYGVVSEGAVPRTLGEADAMAVEGFRARLLPAFEYYFSLVRTLRERLGGGFGALVPEKKVAAEALDLEVW